MAGESQVGFGAAFYRARKLHRIGDAIVGVAGDAGHTTKFLAWFRRECPADEVGMTLDDDHQFNALVLRPSGLWFYSDCTEPDFVRDQFTAIGAGAEFAIAAMALGKSPREAVALACKLAPSCSPPIDVEILGPRKSAKLASAGHTKAKIAPPTTQTVTPAKIEETPA
jgi:hypothetical protein